MRLHHEIRIELLPLCTELAYALDDLLSNPDGVRADTVRRESCPLSEHYPNSQKTICLENTEKEFRVEEGSPIVCRFVR
jgi:hypothetical protein